MSFRPLDAREKFIRDTYIKEDSIFDEIRKTAIAKECHHMIVAASEARMLRSIVEIHGSEKVVEIGCLYGYSALHIAMGLPKDGRLWTLEKNSESAQIAQSFFDKSNCKEKIELVVGDAHENLKKLEPDGPFDMVFIDADKVGYVDYLKWAEKNVRLGGLIIADNTFQSGGVWGDKNSGAGEKQIAAILEFHKLFSDQSKFKSTVYPSFDGIAVGVRV